MAREAKNTGQCRSKFCLRFIPVEYAFYASLDECKKHAPAIMAAAFPGGNDAKPVQVWSTSWPVPPKLTGSKAPMQ